MLRALTLSIALASAAAATGQPPEPIRLTIRPAAAPVPALKYRLLPEMRDLTPGNAVILYYRAFSPEWSSYFRPDKPTLDALDNFLSLNSDDAKAGREAVAWVRANSSLKEVDRAARRSHCDWELTQRVREDGIGLLLPDLQVIRRFGRMLAARARLELFDEKYHDAATSLQSNFALARHLNNAPTLIHSLVGVAVAAEGQKQLDEWVSAPGSPNLYWTLTNLPRPLVDLQVPLQGERLFVDTIFPGIREALADPAAPPIAVEKLKSYLTDFSRVTDGNLKAILDLGNMAMLRYPAAKVYLRNRGWTDAQLQRIPTLQAVYMHEVGEYDAAYDELMKCFGLPSPRARTEVERLERQLAAKWDREGLVFGKTLLPAVMKVHEAGVRCERKFAALRVVEAIRLHLAAAGKLPMKLDELSVPVPVDPATDRPFEYAVRDGAAELIGPPPDGQAADARNSLRYVLTAGR